MEGGGNSVSLGVTNKALEFGFARIEPAHRIRTAIRTVHVGGFGVDRSVGDDLEVPHRNSPRHRVARAQTAIVSLLDLVGIQTCVDFDDVEAFCYAAIPIGEAFHLKTGDAHDSLGSSLARGALNECVHGVIRDVRHHRE